MSSMTATTGLPVERLKRSSSRKMTSEAVTVPPALLIRTTSARTSPSSAAFVSSSRTRTSSGTRSADGAPMTRLGAPASSERNPEMSSRRILARPLPSTVCSRSGSIRGVRSSEMREQPARGRTSATASHRRMGRVYNLAVVIGASTFTVDDVHAAGRRLLGRIHRTPVIVSESFDAASGYRVSFKCENLQRAGSFKIRGALNKLLSLPAAERARGVVAYSSGNHAQGVALAARITGTSAVIGVEADTANDTYLSLRKGERVTIAPPPTIADGIRVTSPGALTFPILRERLTDVTLVTDAEIVAAVRFLALRARIVVEPTGAVGAAAVLAGRLPLPRGARVGVVLSGGNIDPDLLIRILQSS